MYLIYLFNLLFGTMYIFIDFSLTSVLVVCIEYFWRNDEFDDRNVS